MSISFADLKCGQMLELSRVGTEEFVRLPGEKIPIVLWTGAIIPLRVSVGVATVNAIADAQELAGLGDRQRLQHDLMHQRKDRSGAANAESKNKNGNDRKAG